MMKTKQSVGVGMLGIAAMLIMMASGCATKTAKPGQDMTIGKNDAGDNRPDVNGGIDGNPLTEYNQAATIFLPGGLETVHFDFDSAEIRPDARAILEKNAIAIQGEGSGKMIQVAGHCDERGTQEYNLALGERRALAVREYLMRLGVSGSQITTISYGEEMPESVSSDEEAFAVNRRGVFQTAH